MRVYADREDAAHQVRCPKWVQSMVNYVQAFGLSVLALSGFSRFDGQR